MTFKSRLGLAISYLMVSLHQSLQRLQVGALHSLNEVTPETYEIVTLGSKLRHVLPDLMRLLGRPQHNTTIMTIIWRIWRSESTTARTSDASMMTSRLQLWPISYPSLPGQPQERQRYGNDGISSCLIFKTVIKTNYVMLTLSLIESKKFYESDLYRKNDIQRVPSNYLFIFKPQKQLQTYQSKALWALFLKWLGFQIVFGRWLALCILDLLLYIY